MTSGFLNAIATYYLERHKDNIDEYCFVFPSQRAGVFFTNYLRQQLEEPLWAPKVITVNDLFANISQSIIADNITLLFSLHQIYKEISTKDISFDEFLPWGEMLISDFDDIDKYLVNVDQLFSNLQSLKELEDDYSHLTEKQLEAIRTFWSSFDPEKRSSHQNQFLENWNLIPKVYKAFRECLESQQLAYEGMVYRSVAENISKEHTPDLKWDKIVFIGLNALTPAEKKLMTHLKDKERANFFWDYSNWMTPQDDDEATKYLKQRGPGLFINANKLAFPSPKDFTMPLAKEGPDITITAVANPTEQLKSVHSFLKEEYEPEMKTAVVLADETMLMPALHGIPGNVDRINVTMGYPLNHAPVFGLIKLLFDMQSQARGKQGSNIWLYHRHVLPILQHQYISLLAKKECRDLQKELVSKNIIFVKATELHRHELFELIFKKINNGDELAEYLINILTRIFELLNGKEDRILEQEFVFALQKSIVRLQDLLEQNQQTAITPDTWMKLFRKLAEFQTVPFKGEPLAGLQVMGILETRALDFDKLIILDMNEGIFPRASAPNTFIPSTLRAGFELPTIEFQDTIFAYYFFRLIHRAKKVEVLYSTSAQGMKASEKSRYLYQLEYEFDARLSSRTSSGNVALLAPPEVVANKTDKVMQQLDKFKEGGKHFLSPSALSLYIECPMRFYYQKVANIKEPDEITEEADARIFGLIFHEVVEQLYQTQLDKTVDASIIDHWIKTPELIDQLIREGFDKHLTDYEKGRKNFTEIHGKNVMVFEVIKRYLLQFLKLEKKKTPFEIVDLERKVNWKYQNDGLNINIGGYIDRLEAKDGILKVTDYKTGTGDASCNSVEDLFNTSKHKKIKATFQTLLYSLILDETGEEVQAIQPEVIWVRDVFKSSYDTQLYIKAGRTKTPILLHPLKEAFREQLDNLLDEIFNPDIAFSPTEDLDKCRYCTYKVMCNR